MTEQLPIEIECFLIKHGFFEPGQLPDFEPYRFKHRTKQIVFVSTTPARRSESSNNGHAPIHIAKPKQQYVAWKPTYEGEEPPF